MRWNQVENWEPVLRSTFWCLLHSTISLYLLTVTDIRFRRVVSFISTVCDMLLCFSNDLKLAKEDVCKTSKKISDIFTSLSSDAIKVLSKSDCWNAVTWLNHALLLQVNWPWTPELLNSLHQYLRYLDTLEFTEKYIEMLQIAYHWWCHGIWKLLMSLAVEVDLWYRPNILSSKSDTCEKLLLNLCAPSSNSL